MSRWEGTCYGASGGQRPMHSLVRTAGFRTLAQAMHLVACSGDEHPASPKPDGAVRENVDAAPRPMDAEGSRANGGAPNQLDGGTNKPDGAPADGSSPRADSSLSPSDAGDASAVAD